jgi:hypothetical protein
MNTQSKWAILLQPTPDPLNNDLRVTNALINSLSSSLVYDTITLPTTRNTPRDQGVFHVFHADKVSTDLSLWEAKNMSTYYTPYTLINQKVLCALIPVLDLFSLLGIGDTEAIDRAIEAQNHLIKRNVDQTKVIYPATPIWLVYIYTGSTPVATDKAFNNHIRSFTQIMTYKLDEMSRLCIDLRELRDSYNLA